MITIVLPLRFHGGQVKDQNTLNDTLLEVNKKTWDNSKLVVNSGTNDATSEPQPPPPPLPEHMKETVSLVEKIGIHSDVTSNILHTLE